MVIMRKRSVSKGVIVITRVKNGKRKEVIVITRVKNGKRKEVNSHHKGE